MKPKSFEKAECLKVANRLLKNSISLNKTLQFPAATSKMVS